MTNTGAYPQLSESTEDFDLDFLAPADMPGRIGTFADFEVVRVVGRGGMGLVLHGFDTSLHRDVAIKVLDPELSSTKTARQRFCREARAAAAVTHENIVTVHQVNEDNRTGLPYLVMQLVNGESLEQRLRREGRLNVRDVIHLGAQAAAGLSAAHANGLIHRDVKPGNMLIESGERLKLTDFGLARATEDMKLTRTGYVSGTPLYMAPEQARGEEVDARADLFSLGVVLYETLAGKPPFEGNTPLAVLRQVADTPHTPLRRLNADVPEWLEDVIDGLLAKTPDDRIQTAAEVAQVLAAHAHKVSRQECTTAAEPCPLTGPAALSQVARRKHRRKILTLMAVPFFTGILLGVIGAWAVGLIDHSTPPNTSSSAVASVVYSEEPIGETRNEYISDGGAVWSADANPDGRTLAVGLEDGRIRLFDMVEGHVKIELTEHTGPVWCIAFHPDGQSFVSASDDGTVKLWNVEKRKALKTWPIGSGVRAVDISKNGMHLAIGDRAGMVQVINLKTQEQVALLKHGGSVHTVAFSKPDGLTVASAGSDKVIKLWDITHKELQQELVGHKGPIYAVTFSPCGQYVASAGWDKVIRIWSTKNGQLTKELKAHDSDVWSVAYDDRNSCEGYLASAGGDGTVRLWDPETGRELQRIKGHKPVAHVVRFATDGSMLISGGRDGVVRLWTVKK
jgi:WD40 repeat protein